MRKGLLRSVYVMGILVFLGWMCCSNWVVGRFSPNPIIEEVEFSDYFVKDNVVFWIDEVQGLNDLMETLRVSGWAFVETEYDNSAAWTDILLVNDMHCYRVGDSGKSFDSYINRPDVISAYAGLHIPQDLVGYVYDYSSFVVKDGIYDVYIFRWENAHNYGLVKTGKQLIKNREKIQFQNQ